MRQRTYGGVGSPAREGGLTRLVEPVAVQLVLQIVRQTQVVLTN